MVVAMLLGGCGPLLEFECEDRVLSESPSPDGAWVATTFRRNCGATTSYMTNVALRESGRRFDGDEGRVFVAKHEQEVSVAWIAPDRLAVSCMTCAPPDVSTRESWRTVTVEHR